PSPTPVQRPARGDLLRAATVQALKLPIGSPSGASIGQGSIAGVYSLPHRCREAASRSRKGRTMASTETTGRAALARRGYESFQTGDMDTLRLLLASDIAWHSPGQGAGHFHGVDAVMAEFGRLFEDTDGSFRVSV